MQLKDILFYDSASKELTAFDQLKDIKALENDIIIYKQKFKSSDFMKRILRERHMEFKSLMIARQISDSPAVMIPIMQNFDEYDLVNMKLELDLTKMEKDRLSFSMKETIESMEQFLVGNFTVERNVTRRIKKHSCKGFVAMNPVITDTRLRRSSDLAESSAGGFIGLLGTYLLGQLDGKWEDILSGEIDKKPASTMEKPLMQENERLRRKNKSLEDDLASMQSQRADACAKLELADKEIARLKSSVSELQEELWKMMKAMPDTAQDSEEDDAPAYEYYHVEDGDDLQDDDAAGDDDVIEENGEKLRNLAIYVIGGSESWNKKAREKFPYMKFLGNSKSFDGSGLKFADVLVANINSVAHCTIHRAKLLVPDSCSIVMTDARNLGRFYRKVVREVG